MRLLVEKFIFSSLNKEKGNILQYVLEARLAWMILNMVWVEELKVSLKKIYLNQKLNEYESWVDTKI